ncbi:hypothetical protein [Ramlibacter alkalitolerans]|uniref:Uncharacterized protein n=1 Tax=Ramlibacter alkalitolerans TaxID=2039631 RepID=A0ABS1JIB8_9BURK|nr:hypothetical protein [Ramlibacter alkalitolerans]MBL0423974.1 hypothetical protein [Ramlibacter alkalitolerans]
MARPDLRGRPVLLAGLAIAATIALVVASVFLLLRHWQLAPGADRVPARLAAPPAPALQSAPQQDLAAYRAEKERALHTLAWVDRAHGIARIPIEDAMELLLRRAGSAP